MKLPFLVEGRAERVICDLVVLMIHVAGGNLTDRYGFICVASSSSKLHASGSRLLAF